MWRDSTAHVPCGETAHRPTSAIPHWVCPDVGTHMHFTRRGSKDDEQGNICLRLINRLFLASADENEVTGYLRCFSKTEGVSNCFHDCGKCLRKTTWKSFGWGGGVGSPLEGLVHHVMSGKSWQWPAWDNYLHASIPGKEWPEKANPTLAFFLLSPESQHVGSCQSQNWSFFLNERSLKTVAYMFAGWLAPARLTLSTTTPTILRAEVLSQSQQKPVFNSSCPVVPPNCTSCPPDPLVCLSSDNHWSLLIIQQIPASCTQDPCLTHQQ